MPELKTIDQKTIGEIVADDYRTAAVFEKHGIDFCCGGKFPLAAICLEKGLDLVALVGEIEAIRSKPAERSQNYGSWDLPFLADYIINAHHGYFRENSGQIAAYASKIAEVHGARHPEVTEIADIFASIIRDMATHLRQEEEELFPAIKRVDAARKAGAAPEANDLEIIKIALVQFDREHEEIGDAIHRIRALSNGYAIPGDVCNTFAVTYQKLEEFEDDLHKHVHLENNILFPKAAKM